MSLLQDVQNTGAADFGRPLFVVSLALFAKDGKVLLCRRPEGKNLAGMWEFPGGKVEKGETPSQALVREITEELSLTLAENNLIPASFACTKDIIMLLYFCKDWEGTVIPTEKQETSWILPEHFKDFPMPEADILLCRQVWYNDYVGSSE
ncbi:MAG: (deoxy)nucleoside triphosphate pyrophosphohydrolase [Alphaproteobacteria bacterium]|nr:(deoxy)nucleoside triphosphate pyrophosphohydrolase [Alphaproteobacteria bacterium]